MREALERNSLQILQKKLRQKFNNNFHEKKSARVRIDREAGQGRDGTSSSRARVRNCGELAECLRWRHYSRSLAATRRARHAPGVSVECSGAEAHTFDNIKQKN